MLNLSARDLVGIPLRALGITRLRRGGPRKGDSRVIGGLADLSTLEQIVRERIPWRDLEANLAKGRPGALCVACTEVRSGIGTIFISGPLSDPSPWSYDPKAKALSVPIEASHVGTSAAIPFLFPAVQIGNRCYVDGSLRMNTPLSPPLRLGAERVLVIDLRHSPRPSEDTPAYPEEVITKPAFMLGKVLDALMLDPLDYELARVQVVNRIFAEGQSAYGEDFLERINVAVRAERGVGYRHVRTLTIRPSEDLGAIPWRCYREDGSRTLGTLGSLLSRAAMAGVHGG